MTSSATATPPPAAPPPPAVAPPGRRGPAGLQIVGIVLAGLAALLLAGGGGLLALDHDKRDADGYFTTPTAHVAASGYAVSSQGLDLSGSEEAISKLVSRVRVTADSTNGRPVFVGIARKADVERYLATVARSEISDVDGDARVSYAQRDGRAPSGSPLVQRFWSATATGTGTQSLTWKPHSGHWEVVFMNADGSRGVRADVRVAARTPLLVWTGRGLIGAALIMFAAAGVALVAGSRRARG